MPDAVAGDPSFVLSVIDDELQQKVIRLVTSDLTTDEVIARLLELMHGD